jgi:hypothetical protein
MRKEYVFLVYRWVKSFQNSGSIFSQKIQVRLKPEFGDMNIYQMKPSHILNFRNKLIGILQPHTINLYIELMSTIFNYFSKYRNMKIDNPTLKVDKLKVNNTRKRILTKNDILYLREPLADYKKQPVI